MKPEPTRMDIALERIRRQQHRMGPDVPFWVQDQLDIAHDILRVLGRSFVWGLIWSLTLTGLYEIYCLSNRNPFPSLMEIKIVTVNVIFLWIMGGSITIPFCRSKP